MGQRVFKEGFVRPKPEKQTAKVLANKFVGLAGRDLIKGQPVRWYAYGTNSWFLGSPKYDNITVRTATSFSPDAPSGRTGVMSKLVRKYVDSVDGIEVSIVLTLRHRILSGGTYSQLEYWLDYIKSGVLIAHGGPYAIDSVLPASTDWVCCQTISNNRLLVIYNNAGSAKLRVLQFNDNWSTHTAVGSESAFPANFTCIGPATCLCEVKPGLILMNGVNSADSRMGLAAISIAGTAITPGATTITPDSTVYSQYGVTLASDGQSGQALITYYTASQLWGEIRVVSVSDTRVVTLGTTTLIASQKFAIVFFIDGKYRAMLISGSSGDSKYSYCVVDIINNLAVLTVLFESYQTYSSDYPIGRSSYQTIVNAISDGKKKIIVTATMTQDFWVIENGIVSLNSSPSWNANDGTKFNIIPIDAKLPTLWGYSHNISAGLRADYGLAFCIDDRVGTVSKSALFNTNAEIILE